MSELTAKYRDARGMLLLGKLALARGYALEHAAFPTIGVPDYTPIGPPVEPALVYSIVRQESWFNPKTVSSANALGLMQVTPAAGKYIAEQVQRRRSTRSACSATCPTTCRSARPSSATSSRTIAAPTSWRSPPTTPAAAA